MSHARKQPTPPNTPTTHTQELGSPSDSLPELDMTDFAPAKAVEELRRRPIAPRQRSLGDFRVIYTSENLELGRATTNEEDEYHLRIHKPLTKDTVDGERVFVSQAQADRLTASGFDDISDRANGSAWRADARKVHEIGTDLNVMAVMLDRKGERLAEGRGR